MSSTEKRVMVDAGSGAVPGTKTAQRAGGGGGSFCREEHAHTNVIDIRRMAVETNIKGEILDLFHAQEGPRKLPTLLLYDERGLQLFEEITYLEEYYLTNNEIDLLKASSSEIAEAVAPGSMIIELGSGHLRKVKLLLQALEDAKKTVDYYALDLSEQELRRTLAQLPTYQHVSCHGLLGTYDDGREWLKGAEQLLRRKCILSLGSSIGNFHLHDAADFLRSFADVLRTNDIILIGLDGCENPAKVYQAYNDKHGLTHQFILNGLKNANKILGEVTFREADWKVIGEYVYDSEGGRHQAFYTPRRDTHVLGELVRAHERIQVEQSLKYPEPKARTLWNLAGMEAIRKWTQGKDYGLYMLVKPTMPFSLIPDAYARTALPTEDDWEDVWKAWDVVTRQMLPQSEVLNRPIKLRNAFIFYLGHIPTFADMQLSKATKEPYTEPSSFVTIFERGIDPDVDNPNICHAHSEIPDEWPSTDQILAFQDRVRSRMRGFYARGLEQIPRKVGRAIWLGFEHELMHLETLLYMMLQSDGTLPPAYTQTPDFERMAQTARERRVPNQWFNIPAQELTIGLDDPEDGTDPNCHYGWDNEKPQRKVKVGPFQAKGRPMTNEEYARYLHEEHVMQVPASWMVVDSHCQSLRLQTMNAVSNRSVTGWRAEGEVDDGHAGTCTNGHRNGFTHSHSNENSSAALQLPAAFLEDKAVRTVYGLVPLKYALDWPVSASYDELKACAAYLGGRIPTYEEARSIYAYSDILKREEAERQLGKTVPAVNGHLSNNGVQETPPTQRTSASASASPCTLFHDLDGANVGFHHWHPVPVTGSGTRLAGQAEMGGVWEWTSSVLRPHEGFHPMSLYPGYTADFFDGKHNIVLGGSWATHPRIAGRSSFVNWYQRNYLYAWAGARLVRDIE